MLFVIFLFLLTFFKPSTLLAQQVGGVSGKPCDYLFQTNAVLRASRLPLLRSALQSVTSAYSEAKGRYRLLGLVGGVAEVGVRQISDVAMRQATPILQSLEPQSRPSFCC